VTKEARNENKLISLYVDDQSKALRFYTEYWALPRRPISVMAHSLADRGLARGADGTELQLALNNNPAAKAYQQAIFQQSQPAANFISDDIHGDYERIKTRGAEFTCRPPT